MVNAPDSRPHVLLTGASVLAGVSVSVLGHVVLAGTPFDIPNLGSGLPGLATMKANAAVCFLLMGLGLCLLTRDRPIARGTAQAGRLCRGDRYCDPRRTCRLLELGDRRTPLDRDSKTPRDLNPGRMAVATASSFHLAASALLFTALGARHPRALDLRAVMDGLAPML
jgi:hypothetical protein